MKMIIGGACQGKSDYAKAHYPGIRWSDGASCGEEEIFSCEGIVRFHLFVRRWMQAGKDTDMLAKRLQSENPGLILVTDEIGYGLVPVDAFEREYREQTGRICTKLAAVSDRVDRVVCGIGKRIK